MKPLVLIILDGWGIAGKSPANALSRAKLPTIERIEKFYPFCLLQAAGKALGLPWGEAGNDALGHFCIGTGRTLQNQISHAPKPRINTGQVSFGTGQAKIKNQKYLPAQILQSKTWAGESKFKNELNQKINDGLSPVRNALSEVISKAELKQLKIAESIKFEYLTYFFNGLREEPFPREEKIIIPAAPIRSFDLFPKMRTEETTNQILNNLEAGFDFIAANFAAPDAVGRTGNLKAAIEAAEIVDRNLARVLERILEINGTLIITSDHGKIEKMLDLHTGKPFVENTINPVPFYLINYRFEKEKTLKEIRAIKKSSPSGILTDIAPTIIELMGLKQPKEMTVRNLLSPVGNDY